MAVLERIATLRLDNGLGAFRQWQATATVLDTAAGASVAVAFAETSGGVPFTAPTTIQLIFKDGNGVVIRTITAPVASQDFFFTANGLSGGGDRCGQVEIVIRVVGNNAGVDPYDVASDGSTNDGVTSYTTTTDRGWIRGTTTLIEAISNVALGGAKNQPAEFDESLFVRLTCGAVSYVARALAVAFSSGALSGNTNSSTAAQRDASFANVVDDRFPAALTASVGITVTVPNAALTGQPDWTHTVTTDDTIDVDPRINVQWHLQKDQATFDTSYHDPGFSMLASEVGQVAARFKKRRTAAGVNGLSVTLTADPVAPGSNSVNSSVTATRDAELGWSDLVDIAPTGKPGGTWNVTADVTAPSNADLDSLLVTPTVAILVLAPNPAYAVLCGGGSGVDGQHFVANSDDFVVGGGLVNGVTGQLLTPSGTPTVTIARQTAAGKVEYLDAAFLWNEIVGNEQAFAHNLIPANLIIPGADPRVYLFIITVGTVIWASKSVSALLKFQDSGGTPYIGQVPVFVSAGENRHTGYKFDPIGLFK